MSEVYYDFQRAPVQVTGSDSDLIEWARSALDNLFLFAKRIRSRRRLIDLDDRMLTDIGLNRGEALREYEKPFWKE